MGSDGDRGSEVEMRDCEDYTRGGHMIPHLKVYAGWVWSESCYFLRPNPDSMPGAVCTVGKKSVVKHCERPKLDKPTGMTDEQLKRIMEGGE